MTDVDEWLDQFSPEIYRELIASHQLDPDPVLLVLERVAGILKIGFATIVNGFSDAELTPDAFEPLATARNNRPKVYGPNQAAQLFELEIGPPNAR